MRERTVRHIKTQRAVFHAGNQVQLSFAGSLPHALHHPALIRHHFLQRIGHDLLAAKQNLRLPEEIQQLTDKVQAGGIGDGVQRLIPGKQFLPGERFRTGKLHLDDRKGGRGLHLDLFLGFLRTVKQR